MKRLAMVHIRTVIEFEPDTERREQWRILQQVSNDGDHIGAVGDGLES